MHIHICISCMYISNPHLFATSVKRKMLRLCELRYQRYRKHVALRGSLGTRTPESRPKDARVRRARDKCRRPPDPTSSLVVQGARIYHQQTPPSYCPGQLAIRTVAQALVLLLEPLKVVLAVESGETWHSDRESRIFFDRTKIFKKSSSWRVDKRFMFHNVNFKFDQWSNLKDLINKSFGNLNFFHIETFFYFFLIIHFFNFFNFMFPWKVLFHLLKNANTSRWDSNVGKMKHVE